MAKQDQGRKMGAIIAKAWADDTFKQRLLSDATAVLKEEGLTVPAEITIKAVENTANVYYLVLPPKQMSQALDEEELAGLCGGAYRFPRPLFGCGKNPA